MAGVEADPYVPLDDWRYVVAATVGATLSNVTFPLRHAGIGPYESSGGNTYWFGRDSTFPGNAHVVKATDPMSSFPSGSQTQMSSANSTAIEAMCCAQNGDTIHVFTQLTTGAVYNNSYNMATDAWRGASAVTIAAAGFAPTSGFTFVSAAYRPTAGELVLEYCAGLTAMSSGFNMVRYARVNASTGAVIGSVANVDNGGSVNWSGGQAVLGASDRVHFFFTNRTAITPYQRTLSAANALETFPASSFDATASPSGVHPFERGVSYTSGANTRVAVPYFAGAGTVGGKIAYLTSADAPTVTTEQVSTATEFFNATHDTRVHYLVNDSTQLHYLYSLTATQDLWRDTSADVGGWGTDVNELAATINYITANQYVRSGNTVLGMVLDDAAAVKYAEIALAGAPAPVKTKRLISRAALTRSNRY